ncbi:hypothetical protein V8C35DRAFT_298149 [Trichoderma chlorosporum]
MYTKRDLSPGAPNRESHHPRRQGLASAILGESNPSTSSVLFLQFHYDFTPEWNSNMYSRINYSISSRIRTPLLDMVSPLVQPETG